MRLGGSEEPILTTVALNWGTENAPLAQPPFYHEPLASELNPSLCFSQDWASLGRVGNLHSPGESRRVQTLEPSA